MSETMPNNSLDQPRVVRLLQEILALHEAEVDCETCNEQIDCLAELVAVGHDPKKLLPAVQNHLECCTECHEEFEALLCILRAEQSGQC
jgi:deoxycytidylate deaminase